jgi:cell division protein FtsW
MIELKFTSWRKSWSSESRTPSLRVAIPLAVMVMAMTFFGLTMLYSTSFGFGAGEKMFLKQSLWAGVSVVAAATVYLLGYRRCLALSYPLLAVGAVLLVVALFSAERKGAHRWIPLFFGANIQPSELAKLAVALTVARYAALRPRGGRQFAEAQWRALAAVGGVIVLVLAGRDLGTTVLLVMAVGGILFAAGIRLRWLLPLPLAAPVALVCIKWLSPVRWDRIISFLDPEKYQQDIAYQLWNSILALGSGNWLGLGFTQSRMKALYLPEAHTDFIVAIVGEELGLVAILALMGGYALIFIFGLVISVRAADRPGMLLGFGLTLLLTMQAMINLGVVSGALPTKGMPAPFLSYGGSNLVMSFLAIGLLLSIAMDPGAPADDAAPSGRQLRLGLEPSV